MSLGSTVHGMARTRGHYTVSLIPPICALRGHTSRLTRQPAQRDITNENRNIQTCLAAKPTGLKVSHQWQFYSSSSNLTSAVKLMCLIIYLLVATAVTTYHDLVVILLRRPQPISHKSTHTSGSRNHDMHNKHQYYCKKK
jgi:hypothetical protein